VTPCCELGTAETQAQISSNEGHSCAFPGSGSKVIKRSFFVTFLVASTFDVSCDHSRFKIRDSPEKNEFLFNPVSSEILGNSHHNSTQTLTPHI
jgi:hypothetical protein